MLDQNQTQTDSGQSEKNIDELLDRLNGISGSDTTQQDPVDDGERSFVDSEGNYFPSEPRNWHEAGISESLVEELVSKFLLAVGETTIRSISSQVALPFPMIETLIARMKSEQLLGYVDQAAMNDYVCKLTELGRSRAKRYSDFCTYYGAAPVPYRDYVSSVTAQTIADQNPSEADLSAAFSDLLIDPAMMGKLGPAVNSGRGMFLYGFPGNGKTSIAERVTASFGKYIWIPRAISMDRDVVRLYDSMNHVAAEEEESKGLISSATQDERWVRIERPTIVVGGELQMAHLELQYNSQTGISEAPVQMKSNCGTLVIDDFGRQQMTVDELLNRWIVPLEKRYDYLNTSNGKKVQVPFDQLVIFSTNLEPKDLVDDAFLRRIPYKIEVPNPSIENFVKLFEIMCRVMKFEFKPELIKYLLQTHYMPVNRPLRNCHPRDILLQVRNYSLYNKIPMVLTKESLDFACENYFSIM